MLQHAASDSGTPCVFVNGHLADFKLARSDGNQCATSNRLTIHNSQKDTAAMIEYRFLRMSKRVLVLWFKSKMACDPCLVETPESGLVSWLKIAKNEFGMLRIHKTASAVSMS